MNIKSLLLGSAAALVAVSGARAADAVVIAEPEPVEYVRVCDVYGTSYYYIPGTEICLKVGGYMRYDIGAGDLFGANSGPFFNEETRTFEQGEDTWYKRARFQMRMDARTETELGTLRGYAAINFDWTTGRTGTGFTFNDANGDGFLEEGELVSNSQFNASNNFNVEHAYVELGGFRIGVTDSYFVTATGYASGVVNDGLISYGPFTTHQIAYTFDAGNGFTIGGAVEEGSNNSTYGSIIQDYMPHVVVGGGWKGAVWGVSGVVGYDSNEEEVAVKGRIDITPTEAFSFFGMFGWSDVDSGNDDDDATARSRGFSDQGNYYAQWGGDWGLWVGAAWHISDRYTLNGEFDYNELGDYSFDVDVNVVVVPGFVVTPGIGYKNNDQLETDNEQWGGYLRTQFTF
jgi:hypothetical protein